jgi:hypothetical protein
MPDYGFGFEDLNDPDPTTPPKDDEAPVEKVGRDQLPEAIKSFVETMQNGINGMLIDEPDVPAIVVIYLHEDEEGEELHPHISALSYSTEALKLLGQICGPVIGEYAAIAENVKSDPTNDWGKGFDDEPKWED